VKLGQGRENVKLYLIENKDVLKTMEEKVRKAMKGSEAPVAPLSDDQSE
jgi:hypothetical protein